MRPLFHRDPGKLKLHFVGIGGIGMSGIAEVFHNQGFEVSGSDLAESDTALRLTSLGINVSYGHRAESARGKSVVVISSAVKKDNPEVLEARRLRIPVIPRAEMLAELMRGKVGIAVAGTHGKTTTTSMVASVMMHAGLDPTLVIGGKVNSFGGNAKLGQGSLIVAEADESDGSFLQLPYTYGIITNIDDDHLDHYGTIEKIETAFVDFVGRAPFYGSVAVCVDDARVKSILHKFNKPIVTYGLDPDADYFLGPIQTLGFGSKAKLFKNRISEGINGAELGELEVNVPGRHNLLNALGAAALCDEMGIPFERIKEGIKQYSGVGRRFETKFWDPSLGFRIIDDYAHHPTEIRATLQAARSSWKGPISVVFQPHRYTRTQQCFDGFLNSFSGIDELKILDVYPAGESPIEGADSKSLVSAIQTKAQGSPKKVAYIEDVQKIKEWIGALDKRERMVLFLGAGSITKFAAQISSELTQKK